MTEAAAGPSPTRRRAALLALVLYAGLFVVCLYPQSLRPWDTIGYVGDSLDSVYFMGWNAHQIVHDPRHLFDANILFPHKGAMALAGHRMLLGFVTAPVAWATGNPILAYSVALLLGYLGAAMTGRALAGALGLPAVGAFATGALYAYNTYQINEAPRADLLYHFLSILALGQLVLYLLRGARRHAWAVAGLMVLQGLAANYLLLYGTLLLAIVFAGAAVARPRLVLARIPGLLLPAGVAVLVFLPVVVPHLRSARTYSFAREAPSGIDLQHYVSTLPSNLVYGEIGAKVRPQQRGPHFVGFVALALALLALGRWRPGRGPAFVPIAAALALLLIALSLGSQVVVFGHDLGPGPYRLLHQFVPGFAFVRIPERLGLLAMFFVALLAGQGVSLLWNAGWRVPALLLAALVPLEHVSPLGLTERMPVWGDVPAVYRFLATDSARAIAEVPIHGEGLIRKETEQEYFSTYHWKPMIHGYVSYPPLLSVLLRRAAADFPSLASRRVLQRVGVDTVVLHEGRRPELDAAVRAAGAALQQVARFEAPGGADSVFRLLPVPALAAAPLPAGHRLSEPGWRYEGQGEPQKAGDGDPATAWTVPGELSGDESLTILFGHPLRVSGLVLPLRRGSVFPTLFRFEGLGADGTWRRLARLDEPHQLQLVEQLLEHPGYATLGFDVGGREDLLGVRLLVGEGASGFDGWAIPELEVWGQ